MKGDIGRDILGKIKELRDLIRLYNSVMNNMNISFVQDEKELSRLLEGKLEEQELINEYSRISVKFNVLQNDRIIEERINIFINSLASLQEKNLYENKPSNFDLNAYDIRSLFNEIEIIEKFIVNFAHKNEKDFIDKISDVFADVMCSLESFSDFWCNPMEDFAFYHFAEIENLITKSTKEKMNKRVETFNIDPSECNIVYNDNTPIKKEENIDKKFLFRAYALSELEKGRMNYHYILQNVINHDYTVKLEFNKVHMVYYPEDKPIYVNFILGGGINKDGDYYKLMSFMNNSVDNKERATNFSIAEILSMLNSEKNGPLETDITTIASHSYRSINRFDNNVIEKIANNFTNNNNLDIMIANKIITFLKCSKLSSENPNYEVDGYNSLRMLLNKLNIIDDYHNYLSENPNFKDDFQSIKSFYNDKVANIIETKKNSLQKNKINNSNNNNIFEDSNRLANVLSNIQRMIIEKSYESSISLSEKIDVLKPTIMDRIFNKNIRKANKESVGDNIRKQITCDMYTFAYIKEQTNDLVYEIEKRIEYLKTIFNDDRNASYRNDINDNIKLLNSLRDNSIDILKIVDMVLVNLNNSTMNLAHIYQDIINRFENSLPTRAIR